MLMTYTKSQFEMPDGKYLAKFTGVTMRDDKPGEKPRVGNDGKPLPPAMTWDFVIVQGDHQGKKADKLTGRTPTPKSGCGKMLAAIADTVLKDGQQVDLGQFVGCLYRVTVEDNRVSDSPAPVRVYDASAAQPAPGQTAPQHASNPAALWDYSDGVSVVANACSEALQAFLFTSKVELSKIKAKPAGKPNSEAKPVAEWGFVAHDAPADSGDPIPF